MSTKKPKFNILDGFIIVFLVIAIAAAAYLFLPLSRNRKSEETIARYEVILRNCEPLVADGFVEAFQNNEILTVGEKDPFDAKIIDVKVQNAENILTDNVNKVIKKTYDESHRDITLVLETKVKETQDEIMLGDTPLLVGTRIAVKSSKVSGYDYIVDLNTRKGE